MDSTAETTAKPDPKIAPAITPEDKEAAELTALVEADLEANLKSDAVAIAADKKESATARLENVGTALLASLAECMKMDIAIARTASKHQAEINRSLDDKNQTCDDNIAQLEETIKSLQLRISDHEKVRTAAAAIADRKSKRLHEWVNEQTAANNQLRNATAKALGITSEDSDVEFNFAQAKVAISGKQASKS